MFRERTGKSRDAVARELGVSLGAVVGWENGKEPYRKHAPHCTVCGKHTNRGLCETHRSRLKRHGSPYLLKKKIGTEWVLVDERYGGVVNGQMCHG